MDDQSVLIREEARGITLANIILWLTDPKLSKSHKEQIEIMGRKLAKNYLSKKKMINETN